MRNDAIAHALRLPWNEDGIHADFTTTDEAESLRTRSSRRWRAGLAGDGWGAALLRRRPRKVYGASEGSMARAT